MPELCRNQQGQALAEAALAIPILVLLFMGCLQFLQIGLAHIVVMEAVFEAGRQAYLDQGDPRNGQKVAAEICGSVSPGRTEFVVDPANAARTYTVIHDLKALFPIIRNVHIKHSCPEYVFRTEGE